jgi:tRNA dimethylallyltransferase
MRRVIRALEVYLETGTPISVLQRKTPPPYRVLQLGLTMPRDQLYARIDTRVDRMLQDGLLGEVRGLLEAGYTWDCPAMSGLGYIQWRPYLDGDITLDEVVTTIQYETHAFVRRQYTWFNGHDMGIRWLNVNQTTPDDVIKLVQHWQGG